MHYDSFVLQEEKIMNVIYARQSVDKKDSLSIEAQIEQCRKFAGDDAKVFKDKGFSGKNIKRPAFTELLKEIEAGRVKKIFVYRLDRFSRSIADFSRLWELLSKHNVEFYSATENFDTQTPMGRAMLSIILVFAQLERETTAERVKDNYVHRFKLGAWPGGPAPYGFDLTKVIADGTKSSSLIENEKAKVVKMIFSEYAKPETSLRSLAKFLAEKGIKGPKREAWDNVTLSRILHSPVYVKADSDVYWFYVAQGVQIEQAIDAFNGTYALNLIGKRDRSQNKYRATAEHRLTVANHKGIIDSELWLKVQDKLSENVQISRTNAGKYSYLTGLMKCAKCGYAVKINYVKKEDKRYLICSGRSNFAICDNKIGIDLKELELYIDEKISGFLKEMPDKIDLPSRENEIDEILAIEKKIERLVVALSESSDVSAGYISKQIDFLHRQREELLKNSKQNKAKIEKIDFKSLDFDEKKIVVAEFIEKIELCDEKVNIIWKI